MTAVRRSRAVRSAWSAMTSAMTTTPTTAILPSVSNFTIVGHPGHRRVELFQAALAAAGLPSARVIAWRDLVPAGAAADLLAGGTGILRIDSFGEDDEVERSLIRRGEAAAGPGGLTAAALA